MDGEWFDEGVPRQVERDLRNQRFGKGKHRRKWKNGKRTGATIRYCIQCHLASRNGLIVPVPDSLWIRYGFVYEYSLSLGKKKRWLMLEPEVQQHYTEQCSQFLVETGKEEPEEDRGDNPFACEHQLGGEEYKRVVLRNAKKRDKVRLKGGVNNYTPSYSTNNRFPPGVPAFSAKKRPHFLYTPKPDGYRILASDLEDFVSLRELPLLPLEWNHELRVYSRPQLSTDDPLWVFTLEDFHRLPESFRDLRLVRDGGCIKSSYWGDYYCLPNFNANDNLDGPFLLIFRNSYNASKKEEVQGEINNPNTRRLRGRCHLPVTAKNRSSRKGYRLRGVYPERSSVGVKQEFRRQGVNYVLF